MKITVANRLKMKELMSQTTIKEKRVRGGRMSLTTTKKAVEIQDSTIREGRLYMIRTKDQDVNPLTKCMKIRNYENEA